LQQNLQPGLQGPKPKADAPPLLSGLSGFFARPNFMALLYCWVIMWGALVARRFLWSGLATRMVALFCLQAGKGEYFSVSPKEYSYE